MSPINQFEFDVLSILKTQFVKICVNKSFESKTVGRYEPKEQFYLENLADNLFTPFSACVQEQYDKGGGNEPYKKMRALRSSSAMTYNLFGNCDVKITDALGNFQIYNVEYEKKHKTLRNSVSRAKANLDAFLYCPETKQAFACEMKLFEWLFSTPNELNLKYELAENYDHKAAAVVFASIAQSLRAQKHLFKVYDANQMFKHTLACFNYCNEKRGTKQEVTNLILLNCVWELPDLDKLEEPTQQRYLRKLAVEHAGFRNYYNIMQPVIPMFKSIGVNFDIQYIYLTDFLKKLVLDPNHRDYLKRYTF